MILQQVQLTTYILKCAEITKKNFSEDIRLKGFNINQLPSVNY